MARKPTKPRAPKPAPAPASPKSTLKVSDELLAYLRAKQAPDPKAPPHPFMGLPTPPPGVRPTNDPSPKGMAMDEAQFGEVAGAGGFGGAWGAWAQGGMWGEGLWFLGYPYLAELAQRTEYRNITETVAEEMTRKWVDLNTSGKADKSAKIVKLTAAMKRYNLREVFKRAMERDGFFGMGPVYIDTGDTDNPEELKMPLLLDKGKIKKGSLRGFVSLDPTWMSPVNYNSTDPLKPDYFVPSLWYVMGKQVHASRLIFIRSREVPDILKAAYNFGGLSLSQMAMPAVNNFLRTRQSVSDLVHAFTVFTLKTNWNAIIADPDVMMRRLYAFILGRDNKGLMLVDKDTEELDNISVPLGGLSDLQAQAQEQMAFPAQQPITKLLGSTPKGLNACLPADALIETDRGPVPIREVNNNDRVMTRAGFAPIAWAGCTGYTAEFIEIKTETAVLRCTANHPIWLSSINAFVHAENVRRGDRLLYRGATKNTPHTAHPSHGADDGGVTEGMVITTHPSPAAGLLFSFTAKSGKRTLACLSQDGIASITSTAIIRTISQITSNCFDAGFMRRCMGWSSGFIGEHAPMRECAGGAVLPLLWRIQAVRSFVATHAGERTCGPNTYRNQDRSRNVLASYAEQFLGRFARLLNSVRKNAEQRRAQARAAQNICKGTTTTTNLSGRSMQNSEIQYVISSERVPARWHGNEPMYDIQVAPGYLPEFFADGICVHNSGDAEIRNWYDRVHAKQESTFGAPLTTALEIIQLSEFGSVDPEVGYEFNALWELDDAGKAAVQKMLADTDVVLIDAGAIDNEDSRKRLAADPLSAYHGLEGPAPEPPDLTGEGGENDEDDATKVGKEGAESSESGANSGV